MLTVPNELALTESRTMRAATVDRTDVLDKVKALALLPDGVHATTDLVANYYEVDIEAINSLVKRNRVELEENGLRKLTGIPLREFRTAADGRGGHLPSNINSLRLFTRRTMLNVGQLLTESDVARQVRTYLLEVEAGAPELLRSEALDRAALAEAQMRVLSAANGIVDQAWLELKARHVAAKALGEEPEVDPLDRPLYVPDFLKSKGLKGKQIISVQSWFGRRAAALFEAETGERPGKRSEDTERGSIRETYAWTEHHRPIFEETWSRFYAAQYEPQPGIDFGGAA
jgi:hypothetical protein